MIVISATNRGSDRKPSDFYATPIEVVENFLHNYDLPSGDILEPSAGNGNIVQAIKNMDKSRLVTALELRKEEYNNLAQIADEVIIQNYLEWDTNRKFDVIIGNPPYSLALEFVNKSLGLLSERGVLILLLRTAFLESKSRYRFWQKNPLSGLYTLSKRPSFTGKGTDATSYSWFVWDKRTSKQEIKII